MKKYIIAIDGGTTNTRVTLWEEPGICVDTVKAEVGVRVTSMEGSNAALKAAVKDSLEQLLSRNSIDYDQVEGNETLIKELRYEIQQHIDDRHQITVPKKFFRQKPFQSRRQGREHRIVCQYQKHRLRNIASRLECEFSVQRKIPYHRCHQCCQIGAPFGQVKHFMQQRKAAYLDKTCTDRKQREFHRTKYFFCFPVHSRPSCINAT